VLGSVLIAFFLTRARIVRLRTRTPIHAPELAPGFARRLRLRRP